MSIIARHQALSEREVRNGSLVLHVCFQKKAPKQQDIIEVHGKAHLTHTKTVGTLHWTHVALKAKQGSVKPHLQWLCHLKNLKAASMHNIMPTHGCAVLHRQTLGNDSTDGMCLLLSISHTLLLIDWDSPSKVVNGIVKRRGKYRYLLAASINKKTVSFVNWELWASHIFPMLNIRSCPGLQNTAVHPVTLGLH